MAKSRATLQSDAVNTNLQDNTSKLITPTTHRTQLKDERDSSLNQIDDGVVPKDVGGEKTLTMSSPMSLTNLGTNDVPTRGNVEGLVKPNSLDIDAATYTLLDDDEGKVLYHNLATANIEIPLGSNVNLFRVSTSTSNNTSVSPASGVTLLNFNGDPIANWSTTALNKVAFFTKVQNNTFKVIEIIESTPSIQTAVFNVKRDAPISKPIAFSDEITIDTSSLVTSPFVSTVQFQTSLSGASYVTHTDLSALQTWIDSNASGSVYEIRVVITASTSGEGTVNFDFNK